ncbi:MAG: aminotransferase class V-fold PLP-dependent enzyme [Chloroflexi bacterium]|nr:aminotransferase class V-fold PLP-dependent enzyme [Chloroflexota bacterium]
MNDLQDYRRLFPVTERYAYLNHASTGPLPTPAVEAMTSHLAQRAGREESDHGQWENRVAEVRGLAARLIHATPEEIAFVGSTSHGLNIVAAGLDWQAGDNVVCAETEFPANVYPWLNLRRKGVEVRFARAREGRIPLSAIAEQMDDGTRLVALSFVEFFTGYRHDLAAVSELCQQHGVRLCVDGIQGLGALPLDVNECGVDYLAAQAPKWLLGPVGIGLFYCRQERLAEIDLIMAGWRGVVEQKDYFRYDSEWFPDARRFEIAPNYLGITGLGASLELLLHVGIERIAARIMELTDVLLARLKAEGYQIITPHARREERSGIVSFVPGDQDPEALAERLKAAGIVVSARGPGIRVSPHFYNTEGEIDQLMEALRR